MGENDTSEVLRKVLEDEDEDVRSIAHERINSGPLLQLKISALK